VRGETRAPNANVAGNLDCSGASLDCPESDALSVQRMTVGGRLFLTAVKNLAGNLDLMHARVGDFSDDSSGWPRNGKLWIEDFAFENLFPL
ncbi:MAG: hypothetical protein VW338_12825, partial [Rhodospirillaceae bacterium]